MAKPQPFIPQWVLIAVAAFCFVAVADLPYGFYRLLRWVACGVAIAAAFQLYAAGRGAWVWILGLVAVIFNPIAPIHFTKEIWRFFDAAAGICFLIVAGLSRKQSPNQ